jgi:hypothetical protein
LHVEELNILYSSPNVIKMVKSRRLRWAEFVAILETKRMHISFLMGSQKEGCHCEDLDMDGRRIKWILEREKGSTRLLELD